MLNDISYDTFILLLHTLVLVFRNISGVLFMSGPFLGEGRGRSHITGYEMCHFWGEDTFSLEK